MDPKENSLEGDGKAVAPVEKPRSLKALVDIHHKKPPAKVGGVLIDPRVEIIKKGDVIAEGVLPAKDQARLLQNGHLAFEAAPLTAIGDGSEVKAGAETNPAE